MTTRQNVNAKINNESREKVFIKIGNPNFWKVPKIEKNTVMTRIEVAKKISGKIILKWLACNNEKSILSLNVSNSKMVKNGKMKTNNDKKFIILKKNLMVEKNSK